MPNHNKPTGSSNQNNTLDLLNETSPTVLSNQNNSISISSNKNNLIIRHTIFNNTTLISDNEIHNSLGSNIWSSQSEDVKETRQYANNSSNIFTASVTSTRIYGAANNVNKKLDTQYPTVSTVQQTTGVKISLSKARRNIYRTLFIIIVIHMVAWSGNQVQFLLFGFGFPFDTTSLITQLPLLAVYLSTFINPIIYIIKYEKFRRAVLASLPLCFSTSFHSKAGSRHHANVVNPDHSR